MLLATFPSRSYWQWLFKLHCDMRSLSSCRCMHLLSEGNMLRVVCCNPTHIPGLDGTASGSHDSQAVYIVPEAWFGAATLWLATT